MVFKALVAIAQIAAVLCLIAFVVSGTARAIIRAWTKEDQAGDPAELKRLRRQKTDKDKEKLKQGRKK